MNCIRVRVTALTDERLFRRRSVMRTFRAAIMVAVAAASLSAQSGKTFVRPLPGQTPPYSLAVTAGGVIYVAGQLPTDDKGNVVAGDITVQTKQVFHNLRT